MEEYEAKIQELREQVHYYHRLFCVMTVAFIELAILSIIVIILLLHYIGRGVFVNGL